MTPAEIWSELGLEPTQDKGAVRRAYAQRLKVTHPEDDPEAFKRLRAAYETALVWVERGGPFDAGEGEPEGDQPQAAVESAPPPEAAAPDPADPFQEHWERCRALVAGASSGEAADEELLAELHAILKSPILDHLEVFQHTGVGLARSLVEISPKGDALVWPVLDHFGWRKAGQLGWASLPEIDALRELGRRVTDRAQVRDTRAYRLLTAPPPQKASRDTRWERDAVRRLLQAAKTDEAWVLPELRADAVQWWARYVDPRRARRRKQLIWLSAIAAFFGLILLIPVVDDAIPPPPITEMTNERLAEEADSAPHDAAIWARLCKVTAKGWWRDGSLSDCDHAVSLNPGNVDTLLDTGFLNIKVGKGLAAQRRFDQVLDAYPDHGVALYGRSLAHGLRNEVKAGRRDWCRSLELDPNAKQKIEVEWDFRVEGAYEPC